MATKSKAVVVMIAAMMIGVSWTTRSSQENPLENRMEEEENLIQSMNGRTLFMAYCATCHGADARGNGPVAPALKTQPPDLTLISKRNNGKFPQEQVQRKISGEDESVTAHGSREMPVWGPIFGKIAWDQDLGNLRIYNITKYIESLQQK
ncbi:MAG: hypothetical protein A3F68_01025 [Acidobacteria bacterium RIFCSPLOWO2_12_FULL_54_10]|nr:MAG: hypothetical protein A3F68_01025 [Acidobacteria bacterium RIFCSPLOWO2_12_FULL_54_10]